MTTVSDLEKRLDVIEENTRALSNDINSLRTVDQKLDKLNSLAQEIKTASLNVSQKIKKQEQYLEEIKIGADFRKRESENSVREIKTQMNSMEIHSESSFRGVIDTILDAIKTSEKSQKEQIEKFNDKVNKRFADFESKLNFYSNVSLFSILLSIITLIIVILL